MLLTIALTVVFTGIDQLRIVLANSAMDIGLLDSLLPDSSGPASLAHAYSAPSPQPCGAQLGAAGYSVTLTDTPQASAPFRQALGLQASDLVPEFTSISGSVAALRSATSTGSCCSRWRLCAVRWVSHRSSTSPSSASTASRFSPWPAPTGIAGQSERNCHQPPEAWLDGQVPMTCRMMANSPTWYAL